ncbi:ferric reductase-like transmembrane domain-containing protein [Candidatus Dojkabacteria bacterium]|uniref:Ferric reductase-like transmembrane domain-containing protein n=1 Tax=Candidatus Dojkabacteria bacterium TaxID=2099670 RepID=A0A955RJP4_9BACT|nr:ferric reductase-like transmembrane domain-containing protein [Candidatus Dojkabacteria bacterium]
MYPSIKVRKYIQIATVVFPLIIVTVLWIGAKIASDSPLSWMEIPRYTSQIISLWAIILLAMDYLLAARVRILERVFGGLDQTYKLHRLLAGVAFAFIIAHPILLIPGAMDSFSQVMTLFIPFHPEGFPAKTAGIISLYSYIILILFSFFRFLPYDVWKFTHKLLGIPFLFGSFHALNAFSDVRAYPPLKFWVALWIVVGIGSYLYKLVLYDVIGPRYRYKVKKHTRNGSTFELFLEPVGRKMNYEPGQFIFMKYKNHEIIPNEKHPFSISSPPSKDFLRISYHVFGDYTTILSQNAKEGDFVDLYGPYGEFTSYVYGMYKKQIWIAGGIGVTPFLSMLHYEAFNSDSKEIYFYYCNRDARDHTYYNEIADLMKRGDDTLNFGSCLTSQRGRLTADQVIQMIGDVSEYVVLICGPKIMMQSLKSQFIEKGVPSHKIIFEDFGFV